MDNFDDRNKNQNNPGAVAPALESPAVSAAPPVSRLAGTGVTVHAGFPNPAADHSGAPLKLDQLLIQHPVSTYFFRIEGHQWETQGVFDGDLAIIDRALSPRAPDVVIRWDDTGEFCLERFQPARRHNIWGVVTAIIHQYSRGSTDEQ